MISHARGAVSYYFRDSDSVSWYYCRSGKCESAGKLAFVPAAAGFSIGIVFLWVLDKLIPHLHMGSDTPEGPKSNLKKTTMLVFAVTLHNLPEGMAVGVVFAGLLTGSAPITAAGAFALTIGIAIQNFPEPWSRCGAQGFCVPLCRICWPLRPGP